MIHLRSARLTAGILLGAGALVASVVVLKIFEHGSLPLNVGIYGMTVGLCGVVLVTAWLAPRGAGLAIRLLTTARPAVGRLLGADVRRYSVLFALSAALLAQGASSAISSHGMQLLSTTQIADEQADHLPGSLLIAAQSVLNQRDSQIADTTFELVTRAVTGGRYLVTPTLEHPERGVTLHKFVFRVAYHDQACTLLVRPGMVDDEFMAMARTAERSEEDERRFTKMKAQHMSRLLAAQPDEVFEVAGP